MHKFTLCSNEGDESEKGDVLIKSDRKEVAAGVCVVHHSFPLLILIPRLQQQS